jgi:lipopolysaccharide export system permease protein
MNAIAGTLGRYFAWRFAKALAVVTVTVMALALMLDVFELMRRAGDARGVTTLTLLTIAALRNPSILEQVLPFAMLFAAIASFLALSRRLEFVVARAAGVSAWQFTAPAMAVAFALGVVAVTAFNPAVVALKASAEALEGRYFGSDSDEEGRRGIWLRQKDGEGDLVIRADAVEGARLVGVTAFELDAAGAFLRRIEAAGVEIAAGELVFADGRTVAPDAPAQPFATLRRPSRLRIDDVAGAADRSGAVSFWGLPPLIDRLTLADMDATRYRLRLAGLHAKPFFLVAMVLVAASVSLRFFRIGGVARMVGLGVLGGFALYIVNRIASDLGEAGLVPVIAAAWAAPVVGALVSIHVLLQQEDG